MGGLAALFFIGFYIAIAYWVFKRCGASNFRWLVLALAVLIPSGDAVVGRLYLKHLCAKEGGLRVYRVAEHVDGFMDEVMGGEYWVKEHGYQFAEDRPINGMTIRYIQQKDQVVRQENVQPQSQYRVRLKRVGDAQNIFTRNQYAVETLSGSETLAVDTQIAFNGGWAERFVAMFSDAGGGAVAWCTNTEQNPDARYIRLVESTFKH